MRNHFIASIAFVLGLALGAFAMYLLGVPHTTPPEAAPAIHITELTEQAGDPGRTVRRKATANDGALPGTSTPLEHPRVDTDVAEDAASDKELSYSEEFLRRCHALSESEQWNELEIYIRDSITKADSLSTFLPVVLGVMAGLDGRVGYLPVGRGVQLGLYSRQDLQAVADDLASAFEQTDSPLLLASLAGAVGAAFYEKDAPYLQQHVERVLSRPHQSVAKLPLMERETYFRQLIGAHLRLSASVLQSLEFLETLRPAGVSDSQRRFFWEQCTSMFTANRYTKSEVEAITSHLIAHTDESLRAKDGANKELDRLKKIWGAFRENAAYELGAAHSNRSSDEMIQNSYDSILTHWLSLQK